MATDPFSNKSAAAKAGLNLTLAPVEKFVMAGLQSRIYEVLQLKAAFLTGDDEQAVLQKLMGRENQGANDTHVRYPYALLTVQSAMESQTLGNVHEFSIRGLTTIIPDQDNRMFRVRLMPQEWAIRMKYVTNDFEQLFKMISLLQFASRGGWLKFNVAYGRLTLPVSVSIDSNISIPTKSSNAGEQAEYPLEVQLKVIGFISLPTLVEQQKITSVQMDGLVGAQDGAQEDGTLFWSWKQESSQSIDSQAGPASTSKSV